MSIAESDDNPVTTDASEEKMEEVADITREFWNSIKGEETPILRSATELASSHTKKEGRLWPERWRDGTIGIWGSHRTRVQIHRWAV